MKIDIWKRERGSQFQVETILCFPLSRSQPYYLTWRCAISGIHKSCCREKNRDGISIENGTWNRIITYFVYRIVFDTSWYRKLVLELEQSVILVPGLFDKLCCKRFLHWKPAAFSRKNKRRKGFKLELPVRISLSLLLDNRLDITQYSFMT